MAQYTPREYRTYFIQNRQKVRDVLGNGIAIFAGHTDIQSRSDMTYTFVQDASFWWLSGIDSADYFLAILPEKSVLFVPEHSETERIFNGAKTEKEIQDISGVDEIFPLNMFEVFLDTWAKSFTECATLTGGNSEHIESGVFPNPSRGVLRKIIEKKFTKVTSIDQEVMRFRAIKNKFEIAGIQRAVECSAAAFMAIKKSYTSYNFEYEIEADFSHYFRTHDFAKHAYTPIVASGKNACTLHYVENNSALQPSQFCVIDVGAEVGGFCADITRTYGAGYLTDRQKNIHKLVQLAQKEIIQSISPGVALSEYQSFANDVMKKALISAKLIKNMDDERGLFRYMPHAISHGLGIDVHENLGGYETFREGMILTVEPGIYIPEEAIGVRIEDDILVTKHGRRTLSEKVSTDF